MKIREILNLMEDGANRPKIIVRRKPDDIYEAFISGEKAGWAQVHLHRAGDPANVRRICRTNVWEKFRRLGVATKLYDVIERDLKKKGLVLLPNEGGLLSDEAYLFWKNRKPEVLKPRVLRPR